MEIKLIRHATLQIQFGGKTLLVDPMLSPAGAMPPVALVPDSRPNPLVDLPVPASSLMRPDAVLLTHRHRDHWDAAAAELLDRELPIVCQPQDADALTEQGFKRLLPIEGSLDWEGLRLHRTGGRHGRGLLGQSMGPVSGYVLETPGEPTLYIAGDTVWCKEVRQALDRHRPHVAVLFAGAARMPAGRPITMDEADIAEVCKARPDMHIVAAHLEAWNHCRMTRQGLRDYVREQGLERRAAVPEDGEALHYAAAEAVSPDGCRT